MIVIRDPIPDPKVVVAGIATEAIGTETGIGTAETAVKGIETIGIGTAEIGTGIATVILTPIAVGTAAIQIAIVIDQTKNQIAQKAVQIEAVAAITRVDDVPAEAAIAVATTAAIVVVVDEVAVEVAQVAAAVVVAQVAAVAETETATAIIEDATIGIVTASP